MPSFVNSKPPGQDLAISKTNQATWTASRDATSGAAGSETGDPVQILHRLSAGGKYSVVRSFFAFDTSDVKEVPAHAKLDIRISSLGSDGVGIHIIKVQAGATGDSSTVFAAGDFDALQGFSSGATMHNNVVRYHDRGLFGQIPTSAMTAGEHILITLNRQAREDMASLDEFKLAIVGFKDYANIAPTDVAIVRTRIDSVDDSTAANRPSLKWVEASGARRTRTTKGARSRGFRTRNVNAATGGRTTTNGFSNG